MQTVQHQNCNSICLPLSLLPPSSSPSSSFFSFIEEDRNKSPWEGEGSFLRLIYIEEGPSSKSFIESLSNTVIKATSRTNKPGKPFKRAIAALIANLLRIEAKDKITYGYHGISPEAFRLLPIGYRPFKDVITGMNALGYLHIEKGYKEHTGWGAKAEATKFKATPKLLTLAADYGITPTNWQDHFRRLPRPAAIPNPIVLKARSTWKGKGRRMSVDRKDPIVMALAKPIDELNAFFQRQVIEPDCHYGFHRIFANGDWKRFDWDQGARIYSIGGGFQNMPQEDRKGIRINGEATVELDIRASHVVILHALMKTPMPSRPDPYDIVGIDRGAVKAFVAMTLGYDKFHKEWTDAARNTYASKRKKKGLPPLKLPPFADVKDATLRGIPLLSQWPNSPFRWGDLQYLESEVILKTVHTLAMVHDVPVLPVHDSIIVPLSKRALSETVLIAAFEKHIGATPIIEAK